MHQKRSGFLQLMLSEALIYLYTGMPQLGKLIILFWNRNTELSKSTTENETEGPNISPEVLNSFRAKIESDINILRNLTYKALTQSGKNIPIFSFIFCSSNQITKYKIRIYCFYIPKSKFDWLDFIKHGSKFSGFMSNIHILK